MNNKRSARELLPSVQIKIIVSVYELSLSGYAPSQKGLRAFLKGEGTAEQFEGCLMFGGYSSMTPKRLGTLLAKLKKEGYLDSAKEYGEDYYYLYPNARQIAVAYLSKDHKVRKGKEPIPLFIPLEQ